MNTTETAETLKGLVIVFKHICDETKAARLHIAGCNAAQSSKKQTVITEDVAGQYADLIEREFPVPRCKCCK